MVRISPGRVAGRQLEELGIQSLLVVRIAVEEDIGDFVLLAALEDGLVAVLDVEFLVPGADSAGRRVEDDVHIGQDFVHGAGDRDASGFQRCTGIVIGREQPVRHAPVAQSLHCEGRRRIHDTHQFHVLLQRHPVGESLPDDAKTRYQYLDHSCPFPNAQNAMRRGE